MLIAVLSGFMLAIITPWFYRISRENTGWLIALLPLSLLFYLLAVAREAAQSGALIYSYPWVPSLGINLSFYVDGLGLLFGLIISAIGFLVIIYAKTYLAGHPMIGRFYAYILSFMASMLGVVLAGNLITLFVFWELTGLFSYLLIGFEHGRESARKAALQALLVTGIGGLALLAGLLMLGGVAGTFELSELLSKGEGIRDHVLYPLILLLVLGGAFTKSAQFPFHFWLPNAMEAPTPVSTYLHSATMVKAGVYLLARMSPVLGGTPIWSIILVSAGALTMLSGAYLAVKQNDLKRVLAYSTVSVLGVFVFLLGLGTRAAIEASMAYLLVHCLYKAALFLVAGIVDHETGTRDVGKLGGLAKRMPVTAAAAVLAALSMAGLPPLFGFIGKELLYGATLGAPLASSFLTAVALVTNALMVVAAGMVGLGPFMGRQTAPSERVHDPAFSLLLGPAALAAAGMIIGLFPNPIAAALVSPAVAAILVQPISVKLGLLHGFTVQLGLSALTFTCGALAYLRRDSLRRFLLRFDWGVRWGPARGYEASVAGMNALACFQTRFLQSGHLHFYLLIVILTTLGLLGAFFLLKGASVELQWWSGITFYEAIVVFVILAAIATAVRARSRLFAVVALGVVGYSMVLIYIMFGAPDLAMTQFSIDTLTVILLVLVLYRLPRYTRYSKTYERLRDGAAAAAVGVMIGLATLAATSTPVRSPISSYFAENSYVLAKGRNIVNVILVDFRALDTMGEITVLAVAAIGVYSLLKLRPGRKQPDWSAVAPRAGNPAKGNGRR